MRIALVIRRLDPRRGGAEVWTARLVRSLVRARYSVIVVAEEVWGEVPDRVEFQKVRLSSRTGSGRRLEFARKAEQLLESLRPDVIHDQGDGWYFDLLQPHGGTRRRSIEQNLARLPGPIATAKRALLRYLPRYRAFRSLEHRQYIAPPKEGFYIAVSDLVAADFRDHYGIDRRKIRVVYNGVDLNYFNPLATASARGSVRRRLGISAAATVFLLVAVNFRLKGGYQFLEALHRLIRKGQHVVGIVVGRPPGVRVRRFVHRLGLENHVKFVGAVSDPRPFYAAADVYVHPTFSDACSLVVLEAMAMELPVITTQFNGAAALVDRFRTGIVLPDPRDITRLAAAMRTTCSRPWRDIRREAAAAARPFLSWERNFAAIQQLYDECRARQFRAAC